jgi:hypothetical protein
MLSSIDNSQFVNDVAGLDVRASALLSIVVIASG